MKSLRTFQADYELNTTGKLDQATCAALMAEEERMVKERLRQKQELMVRRSQAKLRELGYYQGPVSGRLGDIPDEAITDFQKEHGLNETGRLDGATLKTLFSNEAHEKPEDVEPEPAVTQAPEPGEPEPPAPKPSPKHTSSKPPLWIWSVGSMTYEPKSLYDSTDWEAQNETINPEQAVTYKSGSYLMNRLTLSLDNYQFSLATSRLGGGDNAADFLGFIWSFEMLKKPMLLMLDYSAIESDAFYGGQVHTISTDSFDSELLLRHKPGFMWGLNLTYETYPTLVSAKTKSNPFRSIRFDDDFTLSTLNAVLHYDTVAAGKTGLFRSDRFFPYLTLGLYGGLSYGKVSDGVIDALSTDLSHSFDATVYNFNLRLNPELGVKYIWERRKYDMELTLGYGVDVRWPTWELPQNSDDEVRFYRRNLSHGLIFGLNVVF